MLRGHVIARSVSSEAIQKSKKMSWIASLALAMTRKTATHFALTRPSGPDHALASVNGRGPGAAFDGPQRQGERNQQQGDRGQRKKHGDVGEYRCLAPTQWTSQRRA